MPAPSPVPPSARPWPSPRRAKADWVMFTRRSATLVVAVEQLCGNTGEATTLFSAYWNDSRRNEPALRGMSLSRLLKTAPTAALVAAARDVFRPQSTHGGLSRKSRSIIAFLGSMSTVTLRVRPSGKIPSSGSEWPVLVMRAAGSLHRFRHTPLRIVEPIFDEDLDGLGAVFVAQLLE